jgi:hypothetical protein
MKEKLYVLTCMPDMAVVEELITFPPAPYSNQIGQRVSCRRRVVVVVVVSSSSTVVGVQRVKPDYITEGTSRKMMLPCQLGLASTGVRWRSPNPADARPRAKRLCHARPRPPDPACGTMPDDDPGAVYRHMDWRGLRWIENVQPREPFTYS